MGLKKISFFILLLFTSTLQCQEKFNSINFSLPDNVFKLSEKEKRIKFASSGQIPDLVFSDKVNNANIAFKKTIIPITKDKLVDIKNALVKQFRSINLKILDNKIVNIKSKDYSYIKVVMPTLEGNVISINLSTDIKGKMTMITISYLESLTDWEVKANAFIDSLIFKKQ